ncbi:unnamed protein product [Camellia sinensis]
MPGIPLVARETTYTRSADQMCRQDSRVHLSAEEEVAAEESLSIYCKPVELYNILQRRAIRNAFISSKMLAVQNTSEAQKKVEKIQMTISLPGTSNDGLETQNYFPLYILLARPVNNFAVAENSAVYRFSRACILTISTGAEGKNQAQANFILPEFNKLAADVKSGSLVVLFVSFAEVTNSVCATDPTKSHMAMTSFPSDGKGLKRNPLLLGLFPWNRSNVEGLCLLGKMPMELLYLSWEKSPNLSLGERAEMMSTVDLHSCFAKLSCMDEDKSIAIQMPHSSGTVNTPLQVEVIISAEEIGAKEKSPYSSYSCNDMATSSFSHIIRLRTGNVIFNYRYYNNKLQRTEDESDKQVREPHLQSIMYQHQQHVSARVIKLPADSLSSLRNRSPLVTEDFSCPFCLVKCASFKGLRYHLPSSHDLFNFEFWVTEDYQAVNVSVKTDIWRPEIVADGVNPKQQTFFFCSKPLRSRKPKNLVQNAKHVHPLVLDSDFPAALNELLDKTDGLAECVERDTSSPNATGVSTATAHSYADPECVQSVPGSNLAPPAMLQFAKTRKLSVERSDPRKLSKDMQTAVQKLAMSSLGNKLIATLNLFCCHMCWLGPPSFNFLSYAEPKSRRFLLQKRQFFHSHRAQPMELEQVLSDRDSEDEVDDDVADFEDRRMLDDFVDVTKDEKQMMHLWNSFVRKQRVLADGHIAWACEAFSKLHGQDLIQAPALLCVLEIIYDQTVESRCA